MDKKTRNIIIGIISVILVLIITLSIYFITKNNKDEETNTRTRRKCY